MGVLQTRLSCPWAPQSCPWPDEQLLLLFRIALTCGKVSCHSVLETSFPPSAQNQQREMKSGEKEQTGSSLAQQLSTQQPSVPGQLPVGSTWQSCLRHKENNQAPKANSQGCPLFSSGHSVTFPQSSCSPVLPGQAPSTVLRAARGQLGSAEPSSHGSGSFLSSSFCCLADGSFTVPQPHPHPAGQLLAGSSGHTRAALSALSRGEGEASEVHRLRGCQGLQGTQRGHRLQPSLPEQDHAV